LRDVLLVSPGDGADAQAAISFVKVQKLSPAS
jgi:hypothetical protein